MLRTDFGPFKDVLKSKPHWPLPRSTYMHRATKFSDNRPNHLPQVAMIVLERSYRKRLFTWYDAIFHI